MQPANDSPLVEVSGTNIGVRGGKRQPQKFQGSSVCQGKRKLLKNPERWKIFITVYSSCIH